MQTNFLGRRYVIKLLCISYYHRENLHIVSRERLNPEEISCNILKWFMVTIMETMLTKKQTMMIQWHLILLMDGRVDVIGI
ncbi:hypothetical protein ES332_D12G131500v1 [Gossypium tomentosum]|uniref:Uncharacterized protein n=1 Tax=Gossypium tomentosum TaxID=34277 RepID=A0A5D2I9K3_GOSTO|nr:hypothetical protein ES332_D12G131500v1 [Gossypium tomentosum]